MAFRYGTRLQVGVAILAVLLVLANLVMAMIVAGSPVTQKARGPFLLTIFIITLVVSLLFLILLIRWVMRPFRQLIGEAERAPVASRPGAARNEAEFVLETFQSVVAKIQSQQRELELLNAQARARADSAEKFSDRIVASVPSGLVAFDAGGRATIANAPARDLLEADGDPVGQPVRNLLQAAPDLAEMVEGCLRTGRLYRREEIVATSASGRTRRLGATVAPINPALQAGDRGALCLLTDITEVTELREQVALKRNLESLGEMSAGLAHEFKNALATLHGYAQLIQNLTLDERGSAAALALLKEVRSLTEMVTAFLNFARPQALQLGEVSLRELIEECAAELRPLCEEHSVSLILGNDFPEIRADEQMLHRALLNLMRNAVEAIDADATDRRVIVAGSEQRDANGTWIVIQIRDTGPGIPPSDLQRIFIPFFTTKSKGHGVGLALAHRVVAEHGGTLTAANAADGGAVFTMTLPIHHGEATGQETTAVADHAG